MPTFPLRAEMPPAKDRPGSFCFVQKHDDPPDAPMYGMRIFCPCGCGTTDFIPFDGHGQSGWHWDGNRDWPTLTPSLQRNTDCRWHGFLTRGYWVLSPADAPPISNTN